LLGGSYRAYESLFNISKYPDINRVLRAISYVLYQNANSKIFYGLIKDNHLNEDSFLNVEPDPISKYFNAIPATPYHDNEKTKFISVDNMNQIKANLREVIGEDIFTMDDISRVATLSILFKDMSRTATHQLVRHRNAITQESQRYVDYSEAAFADPTVFKPDDYDSNRVYEIEFAGNKVHGTSNQIGEYIIDIYHQMMAQGMKKEDARSFLPGNVKCRKLYMTFTYANFMKFLELRCDPHAQAEIRSFAIDCRDASEKIFAELENDVKTTGVDEIIADKEVIMNNIVANEPELGGKE
jgi:flavin-dependent thymidylate synthase